MQIRLLWAWVILFVSFSVAAQSSPLTSRQVFAEALASARAVNVSSERDFALSELAEAEARVGFASEAISTAALVSKDSNLVLEKIANIEIHLGRFDSALEIAGQLGPVQQDSVRREIGIEQARRGDTKRATKTADAMADGNDKQQLLYFVELELLRQGDRPNAEKLASRITDPTLQLSAEDESKFASGYDWRIPVPPAPQLKGESVKSDYSEALADLRAGKMKEAIRHVETNENPADVSSHLARVAKAAAELGNLEGAATIADKVRVTGADYEQGYRTTEHWKTVGGTRPRESAAVCEAETRCVPTEYGTDWCSRRLCHNQVNLDTLPT